MQVSSGELNALRAWLQTIRNIHSEINKRHGIIVDGELTIQSTDTWPTLVRKVFCRPYWQGRRKENNNHREIVNNCMFELQAIVEKLEDINSSSSDKLLPGAINSVIKEYRILRKLFKKYEAPENMCNDGEFYRLLENFYALAYANAYH